MSTSSLSKAAATAVQPSLDDMLEEADNARGQTSQARLHDAEAALDAVRRKFGNKAPSLGVNGSTPLTISLRRETFAGGTDGSSVAVAEKRR